MTKPEGHFLNSAQWELWYQDKFDIASPRQMELAGRGLVKGLVELWARHLYETVQPNGFLGFSSFNLWLRQQRSSIEIIGEAAGQVKIRKWVFGERQLSNSKHLEIADQDLINLTAEIHAKLVMRGQTSEAIVLTAHLLTDREDFIAELKKLE